MTVPLVSIIIPTYERPAQLATCLHSLTQLEYPPARFEVIVVNDGGAPLDRVIATFEDRMTITQMWQPNAGPAAARNTGVARARGEVLAFTDDDCCPSPRWLAESVTMHQQVPTALIGGRIVNALVDNPYAVTSQTILDVAYAHFNARPEAATFFASNNMIAPTKGVRALGGFDPQFRTSEDRDICDRWLRQGWPLTYAPEAIVYHAHRLTLPSLWRQHYGYGRGAWRYYTARVRRGGEPFRPDRRFYVKLFCAPFRGRARARALQFGLLMLVAQAANTAGFVAEWLSSVPDPTPFRVPPITDR